MKTTKEQEKIIREYAKENNMTIEQVINYTMTVLQQEMEN